MDYTEEERKKIASGYNREKCRLADYCGMYGITIEQYHAWQARYKISTPSVVERTLSEFKDPAVREIFASLFSYKSGDKALRNASLHFKDMAICDILWSDCCKWAKDTSFYYEAFLIIYALLKKNLYHGDYSTELYGMMDAFELLKDHTKTKFKNIMVGDELPAIVFSAYSSKRSNGSVFEIINLKSKNPDYISIMKQFYLAHSSVVRSTGVGSRQPYYTFFSESIGDYMDSIHDVNGFTENVFWNQVSYVKKWSKQGDTTNMSFLVCFYRWLCSNFADYTAFKSSSKMNYHLLLDGGIIKKLSGDTVFTAYDPKCKPEPTHDYYVFLLNGYENISAGIPAGKTFTLNLSGLQNTFYKDMIISYYLSSSENITRTERGSVSYWVLALTFFDNLKKQDSYPTPDQDTFTSRELFLFKTSLRTDHSYEQANDVLGETKRLFQWANNNGLIHVDDLFFDQFREYWNGTTEVTGHPIPEKDLKLLLTAAQKNATAGSIMDRNFYYMFIIGMETELRMMNICSLTINSIRPSIKPGKYTVYTQTKSSNGKRVRHEILDHSFEMIQLAIKNTESLRATAPNELKDYVFLRPAFENGVALMNSQQFSDKMRRLCKSIGLEHAYTASNLRDTHMTNKVLWAIKNRKSELDLSAITKHSRFSTTLNHYVGPILEEMLESTYHVIIGDMSWTGISGEVVDRLPACIDSSHLVEDDCGYCSLDECYKFKSSIVNSLPCYVCPHFFTTEKHEEYFKVRIEECDKALANPDLPQHDKDDLNNIKRICVLYLYKIYLHRDSRLVAESEAKQNDN